MARMQQADEAAREIQQVMGEILENRSMERDVKLPGAATLYAHGDSIAEIMTRLDSSMLIADKESASHINVAQKGDIQLTSVREQMDQWRVVFDTAFQEHLFSLTSFPAVSTEGKLLHMESPVRLTWQEEIISAGRFLPWINRLEMSGMLDQRVIDLALKQIEKDGQPVCINLSVAAVVEPAFLTWSASVCPRTQTPPPNCGWRSPSPWLSATSPASKCCARAPRNTAPK